jgi:hypothetical protein
LHHRGGLPPSSYRSLSPARRPVLALQMHTPLPFLL